MKNIDFTAMKRQELEDFAVEASTQAEALRKQVEYYEEQIRLMRKQQFAPKSEQRDSAQFSMFNEVEATAVEDAKEPALSKIKPPRKKKRKGSKEQMLRALPKETVTYLLDEREQICPICQEPLHEMKRVIRKELELIPAKVVVKEHVQQLYSCRTCEREGIETPILSAPMPTPLLKGSVLSPSLASHLVCRKYENRDPLYKMEQDFLRMGLRLSRQTLSNWMLHLAKVIRPLFDEMKRTLLTFPILHADETPVQVLKEPGRKASAKSYMWVYTSGKDALPIRLYQYAPSRRGEIAQEFLKDFTGFLQTDGLSGYHKVEGVKLVGCFAHVRRYYLDALKALSGQGAWKKEIEKGKSYCDQLFALDERVKSLPQDKRQSYKQERIKPVMEEFFEWAQKQANQPLPKGLYLKAVNYTRNQKTYLMNYLLDGDVELSNNRAERAVRPFAIGRKNWLFCNVPKGAEASAMLYSIVETAKENQLLPFEYLSHIFSALPQIDPEDATAIQRLLPWAEQLPASCKCPPKDAQGS